MDLREAVALAAVLAAFAYLAYQTAALPGADGLPGGPGYISDEVWYVSAARNMLHDYFGRPASSPYVTAPRGCLQPGDAAVKNYTNVDAVTVVGPVSCYYRVGFPYPDKPGILTYYNLEHPPLAKYVLAAVIAVDDSPLAWRIPSMVAGALALLLVYITARRIAGRWPALAACCLMLADGTFRAMSGIAMLDIYLGLFTMLTAYLYLSRGPVATGAALGLAASVKYSGAFPAFALAYLYARRSLWAAAAAASAAAAVFLLANLPLAGRLGLAGWWHELTSAISWHVTSRPPGPVASTPLDWLLMRNSFLLHASPDVAAYGTPIYLLALAYALYRRDDLSAIYISTYGSYWLVYALGNHTLYSFYTAQFSPLAHVLLAELLSDLSRRPASARPRT